MPSNKNATVKEEYVLITATKMKGEFEGRILSRGMPYLPVNLSMSKAFLKQHVTLQLSDVVLADLADFDNNIGTADILEVYDQKDIRKLRHQGVIPDEESYQDLIASDKRPGYTGGPFPYKAKRGSSNLDMGGGGNSKKAVSSQEDVEARNAAGVAANEDNKEDEDAEEEDGPQRAEVSKGRISKREKRELAEQLRQEKRFGTPPKNSPSLLPQLEAIDRVNGDAELDAI